MCYLFFFALGPQQLQYPEPLEPLLRGGPDRKEIIGAEKNEQLRLDTIHQISFHLTHPLIKPLPSHREQTKQRRILSDFKEINQICC
jgi:hypothetical protein